MALTQYYVNPAIAGNSGTGTVGDPWGDLEYGIAQIAAGPGRDAVNGDQINVKAGVAEILAAPLSLAAYGAPAVSAPLVLRGYTALANDLGVAEVNCNGATMWAAANYTYVALIDQEIHTGGDNILVNFSAGSVRLYRCELHKGASAPNDKSLLTIGWGSGWKRVVACYLHDAGTNGPGLKGSSNAGCMAAYNVVQDCRIGIEECDSIRNNLILVSAGGTGVKLSNTDQARILHNAIYSATAGTGAGISGAAVAYGAIIVNNIIAGFSGVGGVGISCAGSIDVHGYNAFYNCATDESYANVLEDLGGDVALGADPFVNAAAGNFMLTDVAKAALRSAGWPAVYLGAALTDPHLTIGPVQYGEATVGGGFPKIASARGRTRM